MIEINDKNMNYVYKDQIKIRKQWFDLPEPKENPYQKLLFKKKVRSIFGNILG